MTTPSEKPLVIFVDVDDTLIRTVGSKRIPSPGVVKHVRSLHRDGAVLYCWSTGGAAYASEVAGELGLTDCFISFLPKPDVLLDDQSVAEWRGCVEVHPNQSETMTVDAYRKLLIAKRSVE